jgi:hypothetical protein
MSSKDVAHGAIMQEVDEWLESTRDTKVDGCPVAHVPKALLEGQRLSLRLLKSYLATNGNGVKLGPAQITERVAIWVIVAYVILALRFGTDPFQWFSAHTYAPVVMEGVKR